MIELNASLPAIKGGNEKASGGDAAPEMKHAFDIAWAKAGEVPNARGVSKAIDRPVQAETRAASDLELKSNELKLDAFRNEPASGFVDDTVRGSAPTDQPIIPFQGLTDIAPANARGIARVTASLPRTTEGFEVYEPAPVVIDGFESQPNIEPQPAGLVFAAEATQTLQVNPPRFVQPREEPGPSPSHDESKSSSTLTPESEPIPKSRESDAQVEVLPLHEPTSDVRAPAVLSSQANTELPMERKELPAAATGPVLPADDVTAFQSMDQPIDRRAQPEATKRPQSGWVESQSAMISERSVQSSEGSYKIGEAYIHPPVKSVAPLKTEVFGSAPVEPAPRRDQVMPVMSQSLPLRAHASERLTAHLGGQVDPIDRAPEQTKDVPNGVPIAVARVPAKETSESIPAKVSAAVQPVALEKVPDAVRPATSQQELLFSAAMPATSIKPQAREIAPRIPVDLVRAPIPVPLSTPAIGTSPQVPEKSVTLPPAEAILTKKIAYKGIGLGAPSVQSAAMPSGLPAIEAELETSFVVRPSAPPTSDLPIVKENFNIQTPPSKPLLANVTEYEREARPISDEGIAAIVSTESDQPYDVRDFTPQSVTGSPQTTSATPLAVAQFAPIMERGRSEVVHSENEAMILSQMPSEIRTQIANATDSVFRGPAVTVPQEVLKIAEQLRAGIRMDRYPLEIALDPPELGHVRMILQTSEATTSLLIIADRPETAELMRRHANFLHEAFAQEGKGGLNLQFGSSSNGQQGVAQEGDRSGRGRGEAVAGTPEPSANAPSDAHGHAHRANSSSSSGLNLTF